MMLLEFVATSLPQAEEAETSEVGESFSPANLEGSPGSKWFDWHDSTLKLSMVGWIIPNTLGASFVILEKYRRAEELPRSVLAFGCNATLNARMDKKLSEEQDTYLQAVRTRAESGDPEAQFELGLAFASSGDRLDSAEAARWYLKAAEQSHAQAQYILGLMYLRGQGVPRDKTLSRLWMSKAANLGDAGAQYEFGLREHRLSMDENSEVALELKIEAYKWLLLAAAQGYGESEIGCDFVAMDLTHSAVIEGKRRASAFKASTI